MPDIVTMAKGIGNGFLLCCCCDHPEIVAVIPQVRAPFTKTNRKTLLHAYDKIV
jgi:4-aminobutyrate aminotransferase-like enzyme